MFTKIKSNLVVEKTPDEPFEINGETVISFKVAASDETIKSIIIDYLNDMREYHETQTFDKLHIRNMFNKKYKWYINKNIMKLLDSLGYIK